MALSGTLLLRFELAILNPLKASAAGGSSSRRLRRLRLLTTGHHVCRSTGQDDCRAPPSIHADLSSNADAAFGLDLTTAKVMSANAGTAFVGIQKTGPFEISGDIARKWLRLPNPNNQPNSTVVRPWFNGLDVARKNRDMWIVDFGSDMDIAAAALFEKPFEFVTEHVKPTRVGKREARTNERYWLFQWARPVMRAAIASLPRAIVTPEVAKFRNFVWLPATTIADKNLSIIARADDTTFGILHSRVHGLWSLRLGSSLEDRPRYTPTTCFETFPFPVGLTPADTSHQKTEEIPGGALIPANLTDDAPKGQRKSAISIATAAKHLNHLRESWLNPPEWTHRVPEVTPLGLDRSPYPDRIEPKPGISEADIHELQQRTLTKLYNLSPSWLTMAHQQLDAAVASAYGWTDYTPAMTDDEVLKRLLALNLERSEAT